jgi:hypothetical protein
MNEIGLSRQVRQLLLSSVPTLDALELLVFLARRPDRSFKAGEVVEAMRPTEITEPAVRECLRLFQAQGLVAEREDAGFAYRPASPELAAAVGGLVAAYEERPVTLIRAVYEVATSKTIQSFADAFKLKKD